MTIPPVSGTPSAEQLETDRQVKVMKKTKEVDQQVAESLLDLVKRAPTAGRIDTYA